MSVDFVDSNVLVYMFEPADLRKRAIARTLVLGTLTPTEMVISYQVVQETLSVMTRKFAPQVTETEARQFLRDVLRPLWRVMPSQELYERATSSPVTATASTTVSSSRRRSKRAVPGCSARICKTGSR